VDNHIHSAGAMTAKSLLRFIGDKLQSSPDDVVKLDHGKGVTLSELFKQLHLKREDLTVDMLDVSGASKMFHRFDHFNSAYNPFGVSDLRSVFMKIENHQNGLYFAELIKQLFEQNEKQGNNTYLEPRLSVYGKTRKDWDQVADWVVNFKLSSPHVRWVVQIPRIYHIYRHAKSLKNFQEFLDNLFLPLFEVTADPTSHPNLHKLLSEVVAFDTVDDESSFDSLALNKMRYPAEWDDEDKPPYSYQCFFFYANLYSLNQFRQSKGLPTFTFRPHCGESGPLDHLATGYLLANSINHGIRLIDSPTLQYLFALSQVGLSISPLSNNVLFCPLEKNPFKAFMTIGMNVALSTDDPLQFHTTQEPLVEEYTIAKQLWKFSVTDLSEIARNSVLQSGLTIAEKKAILGPNYMLAGVQGNDPNCSNIPDVRVAFRKEQLDEEYEFVAKASGMQTKPSLHWSDLAVPVISKVHAEKLVKAAGTLEPEQRFPEKHEPEKEYIPSPSNQ